jgi:3-hydroxyisobutyrate dehydrogenase-like beta-hydroxyacid dehydrogenase
MKIGWIGAGRMGAPMATQLVEAGYDVAVYNRTRAKAERIGAAVVDSIGDLAGRDVVFTMVADSAAFEAAAQELVSAGFAGILVDCSTVSAESSQAVRALGVRLLAAPVSGNGKVAAAGRLSLVASGPLDAYAAVREVLEALGQGVTYVGEGDTARLVKIAHNVFLGVVAQSLAEVTVLAERSGVSRVAFLDFLNRSVLGSMFTRYKTPAYVNLDLSPTFTTRLLRKDLDLGLTAAGIAGVPMPLAALTHEMVGLAIDRGHAEHDFAALLVEAARAAGYEPRSEGAEVGDGL